MNWRTGSEQGNAYFRVEMSENGEKFRTIDKVPGAGTTPHGAEYELAVESLSGPTYYRLVQVDRDGTEKHYGPIVAAACGGEQGLRISVSSNGTSSPSLLIHSNEESQSARIRVHDAQGRSLYESREELQKGMNRIPIKGALSQGVHYVTVRTDQEMKSEKLVLTR